MSQPGVTLHVQTRTPSIRSLFDRILVRGALTCTWDGPCDMVAVVCVPGLELTFDRVQHSHATIHKDGLPGTGAQVVDSRLKHESRHWCPELR